MTIRTSRRPGAWIMALGALAGCGGEEAFSLQLGNTERSLDGEAVARLANEKHMQGSLSVVGDIDGDGIDDAVITTISMTVLHRGTPQAILVEDGQAYVVYGGSQLHGGIDLASLPSLTSPSFSSGKVAAVGDVDGDGLADFLVAATGGFDCSTSHSGVYLVYGSHTRLTGATPIASAAAFLSDPAVCTDATHMAALGDFDGDGKDDFALGRGIVSNLPANQPPDPNEVLVFYGRGARLSGTLDLLATADATIVEPASSLVAPFLVGAGDVDGDGRGDLIVSTNLGSPLSDWHMEMRLVTGSATRLAGKVALGDVAHTRLPDNACVPPDTGAGSGLGDVDGDGADDFSLIACDTPLSNRVHQVFYGHPGGLPAQIAGADATLHPSIDDFQSGNFSQLIGGDVDGDGKSDLVLADESLRGSQGGVHLIRGGANRLSGNIDPIAQSYLTYVGQPFRMERCSGPGGDGPGSCTRPELAGAGVSVGDLTGDHHADLILDARLLVQENDDGDLISPSRTYLVSPFGDRGP